MWSLARSQLPPAAAGIARLAIPSARSFSAQSFSRPKPPSYPDLFKHPPQAFYCTTAQARPQGDDVRAFNFSTEFRNIRFPDAQDQAFIRFARPDPMDTDAKVLADHKSAGPVSTKEMIELVKSKLQTSISGGEEATKHGETLFVGKYINPTNNKLERYFRKYFDLSEIGGARRETLASYLLTAIGEGVHAPKIRLTKLMAGELALWCIERRFYKGIDFRALKTLMTMDGEQLRAWIAQPENSWFKELFGHLKPNELIKHYFIRYLFLGDMDWENPGNFLITRHSELTDAPYVLLYIDTEAILPDASTMKAFGFELEGPGLYPGSIKWRQKVAENLGPDELFRRHLESPNPIMQLLNIMLKLGEISYEEIKATPIDPACIQSILSNRQTVNSMTLGFGVCSKEQFKEGSTPLQTLTHALESRHGKPLTFFEAVTGQVANRD